MKIFRGALIIAILLNLALTLIAFAQTAQLTLRLSRDYGYGGLNNDIQGLFSMKVSGPTDLVRVVYYIDNNAIGEVTNAPFNLQFNTDNYSIGLHNLFAQGFSSSGQKYESNVIISNFVSASVGNSAALRIVVPVLAIVFAAILLSFIIPLIFGRGKIQDLPLGAERKYTVAGGGICPKCHRPFVLPLFSMNLGISKLARCPYCGKWGAVRIQSLAKLREAERAELDWGKPEVAEETTEDKLRKEIDESKYQ
jgi:hypothetical protein